MNISFPIEIEIPDYVVQVIRNKAIDDFVDAVKVMHPADKICIFHTEKIAEKLKEGEIYD